MDASILASGVTPQETRSFLLRSLPALFIGTDTAAVWVRDSANPRLSFFVAKSPQDALQWIRQSCRPEVLPRLDPVNADNANPDPQSPQSRIEDDSDYGSAAEFQSTAGPDSTRDTSDDGAGRRGKRPMSDAPPSQPAAKRTRDHTATSDPEYVTTVGNVNRRKERDRRRKFESKLSEVFVTEEEDDIQDAYVRENGRKLGWLAKQADCMGMGRREASALVYRASAIGSGEAVENVKAVLAYWRKNGTVDLNRQTVPQSWYPPTSRPPPSHPPPSRPLQSSSQSLVTFTSSSQNINAALSGFRKAFFDVASIEATGILQEILYRHHLARLYDCYRNAEALLDGTRSSARGRGVSDASLVKKQLFKALYPSTDTPSSLADSSAPSSKQWRYFTKCLTKGHRWYCMRETLGSGILALIPTSKVPHSFVERLSSGVFKVFLELIERFYPDAIKFGRLIEDNIKNALVGRQPPRSHLPIEDISNDRLQEMDLSEVVQLFEGYPAPAIEDISSAIEDFSSSPI
jgi:hypothetical protein